MTVRTTGTTTRTRGTLRPEMPPWAREMLAAANALHCEVCDGWFIPDADTFGCPGCAMSRELDETLRPHRVTGR